ncbi:hypothetical protein SS1G_10582 [Sclerotinia sclerotiorum 1980 UF-70]|uniref:Oligosaccharyl transferase subunit n=1 Tax=Sclerotinia sclerotiorum (strain ATCC 18683 / 1980 / Ss-1) TaxID=665079 RepID=A7EZ16_SCLS1|nr:hypothetical protein SS1G_10582 [Sclerotinia sclerotiorum 1980 UF-70]EDN94708.1 hypothetical protein SS1G_10582 [Sclerotinia sclerotiorum 1980 UF-70]
MHFLKTLVVSLLPIAALGAKKPAVDNFERYHTKSLSSTPLKLDDNVYAKLTTAPRDYSVAVLLTALETRFGCQLCREFQPEWDLLSKGWTKGDKQGESRLLFGTLDFMDGKATFQSLNLQTAPVLLLFLPTVGPHASTINGPNRPDGLLSFATISLALKVPRIADPKIQQVAVLVWSGVIFVMYSFLLSVFRIKNGGYPFWLPPFS